MKKNILKVAQLHWGFPPIIGGVETHLTLLLPELVKRKVKVGLLTGNAPDEKAHYYYEGAEIFRTPLFDLNWLVQRGLVGLEDELNKTYNSFIDKIKPDIIHTHNMHYFSEPHIKTLEAIAEKKGIPLILTAHNVWDDMTFLRLTRNINWHSIIAVSHYIKKELMGVGVDDTKITVIHHGTDTKVFHPGVKYNNFLKKHPTLKGKRLIFHPARMGLAKGCDISIKAMNIVRDRFPDAVLVMGGSKNIIDWSLTQEKDIAYLVDLVKIFNLKENVYIDFFALKEMPEIYSYSQACIYPSTACEPFGLTMLEALAAGKAMIVTEMGGMPEIILNNVDGYVIKVKDYEALATNIIKLLEDSKLRKRLGNTGRLKAKIHFTKELMTESHIELYNQILYGEN